MLGNDAVLVGLLARYSPPFALRDLTLVEAGLLLVVAVGIGDWHGGVYALQHLNLGVGVGLPRTAREGIEARMDCCDLILLLQTVASSTSI